jgi:hypothetical protein
LFPLSNSAAGAAMPTEAVFFFIAFLIEPVPDHNLTVAFT